MEPKVSIIVPVYNSSEFLERCLDSILNQTFKEFELICINDGSSDNSLKILEKYRNKDKRVLIHSQKNQGTSIARNKGIKKSITNYLIFIDSDDTINKNMVKSLYLTLKTNNCDLVISNYSYIDSKINSIKKRPPIKNAGINMFNKILSLEISSSVCTSIFIKRIITKNNIYFTPKIYHEDVDFFYKYLYYSENINVINDYNYNYFTNPESRSNKITEKYIDDLLLVLNNTKNFLIEKNIYDKKETYYKKRCFVLFRYILNKISNDKQNKSKEVLIGRLWEKGSTITNKFTKEENSRLILLSFKSIESRKHKKLFSLFNLPENILEKLSYFSKQPLELLQIPLETLKSSKEITSLYIYGAGETLKQVAKEINSMGITINGVIDQQVKEIVISNVNYKSEKIEDKNLKDNDIIFINSTVFSVEIGEVVNNHIENTNLQIKALSWNNILLKNIF